MKKYGTSPAARPRKVIVVQNQADIVEIVLPHHSLVTDPIGLCHQPVVIWIILRITPAVILSNFPEFNGAAQVRDAVFAVVTMEDREFTDWGFPVPLSFTGTKTRSPQNTGKNQISSNQQPFVGCPAGFAPHPDALDLVCAQ